MNPDLDDFIIYCAKRIEGLKRDLREADGTTNELRAENRQMTDRIAALGADVATRRMLRTAEPGTPYPAVQDVVMAMDRKGVVIRPGQRVFVRYVDPLAPLHVVNVLNVRPGLPLVCVATPALLPDGPDLTLYAMPRDVTVIPTDQEDQ